RDMLSRLASVSFMACSSLSPASRPATIRARTLPAGAGRTLCVSPSAQTPRHQRIFLIGIAQQFDAIEAAFPHSSRLYGAGRHSGSPSPALQRGKALVRSQPHDRGKAVVQAGEDVPRSGARRAGGEPAARGAGCHSTAPRRRPEAADAPEPRTATHIGRSGYEAEERARRGPRQPATRARRRNVAPDPRLTRK